MTTSEAVDLLDDILYDVYHYVTIWELVRLRLVSKRWGAIALDHPTYWQNLYVHATTPGSIRLFLARLSASRQRAVDVHVSFSDESAAVALDPNHYQEVYRAIGLHMDHITSLDLHGPSEHYTEILFVIRHPAPLLKRLIVNVYLSDSGAHLDRQMGAPLALPADLLSHCAPLLRSIRLNNITLGSHIPACFSHVTTASITQPPHTEVALPHLPTWFPRATTLSIGGTVVTEGDSPETAGSWASIEEFTFYGDAARWHIASLGGCGRRVTYFDWDVEMLESAHHRLPGPLSLTLDAENGYFLIAELESTIDGGRRSFTKDLALWLNLPDASEAMYPTPNVFSYAPLMERVISLSCSRPVFDHLARRFAHMTALETLFVTVGDNDDFIESMILRDASTRGEVVKAGRLACPHLGSLVIRWGTRNMPGSPENTARSIVEMLDCSASLPVTLEGLGA